MLNITHCQRNANHDAHCLLRGHGALTLQLGGGGEILGPAGRGLRARQERGMGGTGGGAAGGRRDDQRPLQLEGRKVPRQGSLGTVGRPSAK